MPVKTTVARVKPKPEEGHKFMKFDPTFNMGTIAQIVVIISSVVVVYTTIRTEQVQQRASLEAVKEAADLQRSVTAETMKDIKNDMRSMQATMSDMKESLGVLRARAQVVVK